MKYKPLFGILIVTTALGIWGSRWGLPSKERAALVLAPSQRNIEFYTQIQKARDDLYERIGGNVVAFFGRTMPSGGRAQSPVTFLNAYGSFLIKTHELDEAATLVMVSRLNPLKGRWFPHAFIYGGAYLYPLAIYMGALHVLGIIHLVPSALYYYAHPDDIARMYWVIRLWALVGFLMAVIAVYRLGREISGDAVGLWAAAFFSLMPIGVAYAKVAKPHTWAAAWTLWGLLWCLKSKKDAAIRLVVFAGLCWGLALGSTVAQVIFAPFFIWASWSDSWSRTCRRGFILAFTAGSTFLLTNFYLLPHFHEYLEEQAFLRTVSPFRLRPAAVWDLLTRTMRLSLGMELWVLTLVGYAWILYKRRAGALRTCVLLGTVTFIYMAFQMQAQNGLPSMGRLFMALLGGGCILVAELSYAVGWGPFLRWGLLVVMLAKGFLFSEHFRSDRMPQDNSSQAAYWIKAHIPPHSIIIHGTTIPQTDSFPPIPFADYKLVALEDLNLEKMPGQLYAVVTGGSIGESWRADLRNKGFVLVQRFAFSPLQRLGSLDPFTQSNFPVEVYQLENRSSRVGAPAAPATRNGRIGIR